MPKIEINCQNSIKIISDKIIYIDPYKIENQKNDADYIFITHSHYDHFDLASIKNICKKDTTIILPKTVLESLPLDNIIYVEPNKDYKIDDIDFKTIASYNLTKSYHPKSNGWVGYILNIEGKTYYIAGDTDVTEENKNVKCDIALIPIGGTYTMDYKEAAEFINEIKPFKVIPTHYGAVVGSYEDALSFEKIIDKDIEVEIIIK